MTAGVIGFVGRLRAASGSDAELVRAYAAGRDADAFAALVRRHGPLVWATCRRVAGDPHLAEDAFQATFLVLARKAGGLTTSHPLGGWLHAVAVNVSVRARTAAARRKRLEVAGVEVAAPTPPDPPDEWALAMLDEEVERLPAKLRDAVVLCELEGVSRRDAAERLGLPEGTLSSRLAAARKRLTERLTGRGVGPELLAVPAAVPAGLAEAAAKLGAGAVPAPAVLALVGDTMRAMLLKALAIGTVACGLVVAGGQATEPPAKPMPPAPVAAKQQRRETILLDFMGEAKLLALDGSVTPLATGFALPNRSPDGRLLVQTKYLSANVDGKRLVLAQQLVLTRTDGTGGPVEVDFPEGTDESLRLINTRFFWGADGQTLTVVRSSQPKDDERLVFRLDLAKRTLVRLPDDTPVGDPSPDGRTVCALLPTRRPNPQRISQLNFRLVLVTPGVGERPVSQADRDVLTDGRFSSDGGRLLYRDQERDSRFRPLGDDRLRPDRLCVLDVKSGAVTVLTDATRPPPRAGSELCVDGYCWSPDGRRVAYNWQELRRWDAPEVPPGPAAVHVCDADGTNPRVIQPVGEGRARVVDWR